jgi:hypothetical protein
MLWPALSAGAIVLERCVHRESPTPLYYEDQENLEDQENPENLGDQHVLRQEPKTIPVQRS